jgi:WD40 repeat protein
MKRTFAIILATVAFAIGSAEAVLVYNPNFYSHSISRWNTEGPYSPTTFLTGVFLPIGVAVDPSGNVYVSQYNSTLSKYTAAGALVSSISLGYLPYNIRFDVNGILYVADLENFVIRRYDNNLSPLSNWVTTSGKPTSIQFSPEGFVLVTNAGDAGVGDNVQKFSMNGTLLQTIGNSSQLNEPHDAITDPSGNILVGDRQNLRIVKYDSAGTLIDNNFITGFDPYGMLVSGSTLFVAKHSDPGTIRRYDVSSGNYLGDFAVGTWPTFISVNPYDIAPSSSAIPEPGQVAASLLLLSGIGGYVFIKRRKAAKPAVAPLAA